MAQSSAGVAEKIRGYWETVMADPETYDGVVDVAYWLVHDTPQRDWSPSEVARAVKTIGAGEARTILDMLAKEGHIRTTGDRGAWTRYFSRLR